MYTYIFFACFLVANTCSWQAFRFHEFLHPGPLDDEDPRIENAHNISNSFQELLKVYANRNQELDLVFDGERAILEEAICWNPAY